MSGCIGGSEGGSTLQFGIMNPMEGPYSGLGSNQRQGYELGIQKINESDEFDFTIDATFENTKSEVSTARQKAQKLVQQDNKDYLSGCVSSAASLAINSFAQEQEILWVPGGGAIQITGSGCNEWSFRAETHSGQIARAFGPWIPKNIGTQGWIHYADYSYGKDINTSFTEQMKASDANVNIVGRSTSQLGATNFSSYISQIENSEAEFVVLGLAGGDLITFVKQAVDAGLKETVTITSPTMCMQAIRNALGEAANGTYGGVRYDPKIDTPANQDFVERYQEEYDGNPDAFARAGFDAIWMTAQGIQEADDTGPATVKDSLPGQEVSSVFGSNTYRECNNQATNPVWVGKNVPSDQGGSSSVELLSQKSGQEAVAPCSEVNCSL
ncbi:ABC transporter substrate-binding protein [Halopenitus persicus]|uniref:ABC transporter substrate-binding protein n=1 Tax=Halopenitus persicus TaxID=1048396 RepID=UPI0015618884|nr:ABC transporter substrate-binding protein [Halopenitus persicus]